MFNTKGLNQAGQLVVVVNGLLRGHNDIISGHRMVTQKKALFSNGRTYQ